MTDLISKAAAIQAVFDWEQGKISGTIADAIAALPATDAREKALREAAEAWAAFKEANTTTDHFNAVERLDAILRALEEEGRDG